MKMTITLAAFISTIGLGANAASLLTNGDFEAGDTGFSTDYTQVAVGSGPAQYNVDTNPKAWFSLFADMGDNTTGSGNMMMVNGATTSGPTVWEQTVSVAANTKYEFAGWIAAIFPGSSSLSLPINSVNLDGITGPATTGLWENFSYEWDSGSATSATISLLQQSSAFSGNDYALDDLSFTSLSSIAPVPLPASAWVLLTSLVGLIGMRRFG